MRRRALVFLCLGSASAGAFAVLCVCTVLSSAAALAWVACCSSAEQGRVWRPRRGLRRGRPHH
eukprot:6113755-Lingulodinium_polyedra.AAC.1